MKLLVTGGAGFIGSNFIRFWLNRHPADRIINIDKLTYAGSTKNLENLPDGHQLIQQDICDPEVEDWMSGVDAVIHFAAFIAVGESMREPARYFRNNVGGSLSLLDAMAQTGVRHLVFSSTAAVYGNRSPYKARGQKDTPNASDMVYADGGKQSTLRVSRHGTGYIGRLALGVRA